jgi:hypothetical protein
MCPPVHLFDIQMTNRLRKHARNLPPLACHPPALPGAEFRDAVAIPRRGHHCGSKKQFTGAIKLYSKAEQG